MQGCEQTKFILYTIIRNYDQRTDWVVQSTALDICAKADGGEDERIIQNIGLGVNGRIRF